jgi:hypothetical protein
MKNRNADTRARDIDTPSDLAQWWSPPIMSAAFKAGETCAAWNGEVLRFASDRLRQVWLCAGKVPELDRGSRIAARLGDKDHARLLRGGPPPASAVGPLGR